MQTKKAANKSTQDHAALLAALEQIAEMTEGATGGMHAEIYEIAAATLAKAKG